MTVSEFCIGLFIWVAVKVLTRPLALSLENAGMGRLPRLFFSSLVQSWFVSFFLSFLPFQVLRFRFFGFSKFELRSANSKMEADWRRRRVRRRPRLSGEHAHTRAVRVPRLVRALGPNSQRTLSPSVAAVLSKLSLLPKRQRRRRRTEPTSFDFDFDFDLRLLRLLLLVLLVLLLLLLGAKSINAESHRRWLREMQRRAMTVCLSVWEWPRWPPSLPGMNEWIEKKVHSSLCENAGAKHRETGLSRPAQEEGEEAAGAVCVGGQDPSWSSASLHRCSRKEGLIDCLGEFERVFVLIKVVISYPG